MSKWRVVSQAKRLCSPGADVFVCVDTCAHLLAGFGARGSVSRPPGVLYVPPGDASKDFTYAPSQNSIHGLIEITVAC